MAASHRRMVLFILSFAATCLAANWWAGVAIETHYERKFREMFSGRSHEVLVLGTSHAAHGVRPRELEPAVGDIYNFAINGANLAYYLDWYPLYLRHARRPSLVLFAVDTGLLGREKGLERRLAHDAEHLPFAVFLEHLLRGRELDTWMMSRFPLIKERRAIQARLLLEPPEPVRLDLYDRGYVPFEGREFPRLIRRPLEAEPGHAEALARLVAMLAEGGTRVVLFQTPEYAPLSGDLAGDNAPIRRVAEAAGVPFLDYNGDRRTAFNSEQANFVDRGHLGDAGAAAFSRRLAEDLGALGIRPQRRRL